MMWPDPLLIWYLQFHQQVVSIGVGLCSSVCIQAASGPWGSTVVNKWHVSCTIIGYKDVRHCMHERSVRPDEVTGEKANLFKFLLVCSR